MKKVQFTLSDDLHKYFKGAVASEETTMQDSVNDLIEIYSFFNMPTLQQEFIIKKAKEKLQKDKYLDSRYLILFRNGFIEKEEEDLVYKSFDGVYDEKIIGNIYLTTSGEGFYIQIFEEDSNLEDEHLVKKLFWRD
jgi:hypothetical protein